MALLAGYQPDGAQLRAFLDSAAFARALIGPAHGGRKIAAIADIAARALAAPPAKWRVTVLAPRADELTGGVMAAVAAAFGPDKGFWDLTQRSFAFDMTHQGARRPLEFRFFGADRPEQRRRFEATPATVVWLADARDLGADALDAALALAGSWADGAPGARVTVTSRMPDDAHWIAARFKPDGAATWQLFRQPGGRSEHAENRRWLDREHQGYYARLAGRLQPRAVASDVDAEWREADWADGVPVEPRRLALAALWVIRGGLPPSSSRQEVRP